MSKSTHLKSNPLPTHGTAIRASIVLGAGLFLCATVQAGNVLVNADFETGTFSGWTKYNNGAVESTNNTYYSGGNPGGSNVLTHSGMYVGKTWGLFSGGQNTD